MAVTQAQKVDFLLKKIGFTKTKTGLAVDETLSGTKKAGFAEAIPSPLIIANDSLWNESSSIPATPPGSDTAQVKVYLASTSGHQMTVDSTVAGNRAFIAFSTYNNTSSARLNNWIDTQFGASYLIKVFRGDPNSGGVQLSAAGSGNNDGWFFDYSAGVLNFNDTNVPSGVTSSNIYIVGYRYIGLTGAPIPTGAGNFTFNNLTVTGDLDVDGHTNLDNVSVAGVTTFASNIDVDGHTNLDNVSVAGVTTFSGDVIAGVGATVGIGSTVFFDNGVKASFGGSTIAPGFTISNDSSFTRLASADSVIFTSIGAINITGQASNTLQSNNNRLTTAGAVEIIETDSTSAYLKHSGNTKLQTTAAGISIPEDLDVDGHTNLDNVSVAGVSTFVGEIHGDGQRLGSLSSSGRFSGLFLNDGSSYYGSGKIFKSDANGFGLEAYSDNDAYLRSNRGGGTDGNVYLMTGSSAGGYVFVDGDNGVELHHAGTSDKKLETSSVGVSIIEDLDVDGHTNLDNVSIAGVSTFTGAIDANGDLDVDGHTNLDNVSIAGVTSVASLTSGRVVLAGTGGKLEDSNKLTFDGTTLGLTGDANFTGNLTVGGVLTYEDVKNVDSVGLITARSGIRVTGGVIEAQAGENKIPSLYSAMTNLPAAGSYHGMFAHVHATGRGYFAHAGNWLELVNKETNGTVGTGTETYNIGTLNLKDLDVDQHTNLDNVNITGVTTFTGNINVGIAATVGFGSHVDLPQSARLRFGGKASGADGLQIFNKNNGSQDYSFIYSNDTLFLQSSLGPTITLSNQSTKYLSFTSTDSFYVKTTSSGTNAKILETDTQKVKLNYIGDTKLETSDKGVVVGTGVTIETNGQATFTGIVTATGIDLNGDLDVDGHTNLDNVSISGFTTCGTGLLLNNSIRLRFGNSSNSYIYYDAGSGVTHHQITGGTLAFASNISNTYKPMIRGVANHRVELYYDGSEKIRTTDKGITVGTGVTVETNGQATFTGIVTASSFRGDGSQLTGISVDATALKDSNGNVKIQANESGAVHVGIATFQDLDVDGHTNLDNVSVAGVTTFSNDITLIDDKKATFGNNVNDLYIEHKNGGQSIINHGGSDDFWIAGRGNGYINITPGYSNTYSARFQLVGNLPGGAKTPAKVELWYGASGTSTPHEKKLETTGYGVTVYGTTQTQQLNVVGVGTFGSLDISGDLDVDGHTNLDNVSVAGVTTFSGGSVTINPSGANHSTLTIKSQESNSTAGPILNLLRDDGAPQNQDYLGIIKFNGSNSTGQQIDYAKITGKILDVSNSAEDGILEFEHVKNGFQTVTGRFRSDSFQLLNGTNFSVAGNSTFTGTAEFDSDAKFDSTITAGGATGNNGQYLKSTGSGVAWESFPTMRTTTTVTASAGQTTFSFTYNIGFLDVFVNGVKLTASEFTATNGSSVVLSVGCFVGDIVELVSYNTVSGGGGGGGSSITVQDEGSTLTTDATTLNFVGTGIVASGTGATKTITVNAGTADTSNVTTNNLNVVGFSTFARTVLMKEHQRINFRDANTAIFHQTNFNIESSGSGGHIILKTNASGGDANDIVLHGGGVGELLRAHGTGDVDIINTLGIGGSITKASGQLDIRADNLQLKNAASGATYASFTNGGAVELNHNNTKRLETTSNGVNIIGSLFVNGSGIGGGGGSGFFSQTVAGIHTLSKVGIGTADPEFDLDLGSYTSQNVSTASTIRIMGDGASSANTAIRFGAGGNNVDYTLLRVDGQDGTTDGDGNTDLGFALRYMSAGESGTDNRIAFWADNTNKTKYEALSIYNDGRVLVDNGAGGGHGFYGHPDDHFTVRGSSGFDNVRVVGVSTFQNVLPQTDSTYDIGTNTVRFRNIYADTLYGDGSNLTGISGGGGTDVGITTNLSGSFSATPGSPTTINTLSGYSSDDLVVEYTIYIKNGSNIQTQKLLAMRDGTTIDSTQFAVMFSSSLLAQFDATISSGNILLRATPESGITGNTDYKIKREVM